MNAGNIHVKILADAEAMYREFNKVQKMAQQAAGGISGAFADVSRSLGGLIGAASGLAGVVAGLSKLVAVQRQFDVLNSGLITMTGSVEDAKVAFAALQDFAAKTPYSLAETVGAFTKLKALGLDPTERAMTSFGNTAAAMGKGLNQFIEAVADAGTGEFERLKEFGIKASKEGNNVSLTFQGVTTTIRNSTEQITEYLTKIGENQFAGAMETRAKTLDGAISALGDTWDNLFLTISQQNAGGLIFDSVELASGAIKDLTKIVEAMSTAADGNAKSSGAMAAVQRGITAVFETVAVVGANVAYVLKATGIELGGLAAQAAAVARLDFKGAALIGDEMKRDAAAARAEVDALTARILNAKNQTQAAGKSLDDLVKPRPKAKPPIDEDAIKAAKKALQEIEKEAAKGLELYNNLIAETAGFQGDYAEKVSQLAEAYAKNKISLEGLTFAHEKLLAKQPAAVEATKAEAEARKVLADAVIASARAYEEAQQAMDALQADTWQMVNDTVKASKDSAAAVQFELGLIGQTTEARRIAIEQRKIELDLEEKIKKVKATPFEGGEEAQLREINRLREAAAQDSATAISRIQLDEAAKSVEQYDKIFREGFAALIAGGKDSWESFTKSLTTTFKTAVVDQIYKAFAQPFVVNVVANMAGITGLGGPGGAAGAGNSLANGIQTASSLNTLYGTASQAIYGATAGATAASLGYANAVGMVGGDALGALIAANGSWAGVATGSAAAAEAAIAANLAMEAGAAVALEAGTMAAAAGTQAATAATAAASTAGSVMSTVAAAMPYLAAAAALVMIAQSFDDSGTLHMGAGAIYQKGRLREGRDIYGQELFNMGAPGEYNANAQANVSGIASAIGSALDTVATSFGKKAGYEIATAFADDSSGDGAWGALRISQGGQDLINWQDTRTSRWAPKEFADGEDGYKQYLAAVAKDTRQALLDMDLPGWAKTVFNELGDSPSIETLAKSLEQVGRFNGVLEAMGENVLPALADASDSAITALVKAAGGTDALTASLANYYDATATDLDRQQFAFTSLSKALEPLGATLPAASTGLRDWYDGLVQTASAQDLTVQANADQLASLLALNPAITALAPAWDAARESLAGGTTLGALQNAALRGDEFATSVINAAGGLEQFQSAADSYYENYTTQSEKTARATSEVAAELAKAGLPMPKTRAEFKALMDANVALGKSGQPAVNALLSVEKRFAALTPAMREVSKDVENFLNRIGVGSEKLKSGYSKQTTDLFAGLGLDPDAIGGEIAKFITDSVTGANKDDFAEAGKAMVESVSNSIQEAIAMQGATAIATAFTDSIITPIIANIMAGKTALDGVDLAGGIAEAKNQMQALAAALNDPAFKQGMADLRGALSGATGAAGGGGGYTPGLFAIGGSAVSTTYQPRELSPLSDTAALQQEILETNKSVAKLLEEYLKKDDTSATRYEKLAKQLTEKRTELKVPQYQQEIASLKATIADFTGVLDKANPLISAVMNGAQNSGQALTTLAEMIVQREGKGLDDGNLGGYMIPGFASESMVSRVTTLLEDLFTGLGPREVPLDNLFGGVQTPTTTVVDFLDKFPTLVQSLLGITAAPETLQNDLNTRIKQLAGLEKDLRDWYIAQARVIAIEDATSLAKETSDAKARTAELKRTGGLEDPVTKLKEQFRDKMQAIDEGIGAALQAEIDLLLGNKADTRALDQVLAQAKDKKATLTAPSYLENTLTLLRSDEVKLTQGLATLDADIQQQLQNWANSVGTAEEAYQMGLLNNMTSTSLSAQASLGAIQAEIARLTAGGLAGDIAAIDKAIADTEEKIKAAILAATDPAKRAELEAEIEKYKGGVREWLKAQQELLATEMLVDINQQIKALEAPLLGPIDTIKAGLDKYIKDLTTLGQLTPEAQAAIDKLGGLQLGQARKSLYDQLLSPEEKTMRDALDLNQQFAKMGIEMPKSTEALRALIDATTDPTTRDSLLQLIPAFLAIQPAADSASSAIAVTAETVQAAYDKIKAANRSAEDVANERISLEDRLSNATATAAQIADKARNAIDPLNRSLYDMVIAAESAKQALADAKTATDTALGEVRRLINEQIGQLQKTFGATDKALAAVDRAAAAQRATLQKQITDAKAAEAATKGIFDAVRNAARELRGQVSSTAAMQAEQARALIRNAIATGVLPDQKVLDEAIGATRAGLEAQVYATEKDAEFAKLVLAGELEKLQKIAEPQLSTAEWAVILAEDQLTALDEQVKQAKAMVDGIRGVDGRVLTVAQAVDELQTAIDAEILAREQINKLQGQLTAAEAQYNELRGIKTGVDAIGPAITALAAAIAAEKKAAAAAPVTTITNYVGTHTTASYYETKVTDPVTGVVSGTGGGRVTSRSVGAYADGGYYPGGLALVGEEGPELINFANPGQVYTAPQTQALLGGMGGSERMASLMGEMAQEIRSLRAEVVELRRTADKGNEHTAVIAQAHEGRGQAPLLVEIAQ